MRTLVDAAAEMIEAELPDAGADESSARAAVDQRNAKAGEHAWNARISDAIVARLVERKGLSG